MEIKGFIPNSLLDWEGYIVSTIYLPYCNFRCPYCQNPSLVFSPKSLSTIPFEELQNYWKKNKKWIDGVCITGGEPCLYRKLPGLLREIKDLGLKVKLDTNGTFPRRLEEVIQEKLVDYIAMDIKAPLDVASYQKSTGIRREFYLGRIVESIQIIRNSGLDYEFRTTVVPTLHTEKDIEEIASYIQGARAYYLQNFVPRDTLNPAYEKIAPYPREKIESICKRIAHYVVKCGVRGK
ncbi:MAG: anaerobic ribonucleoside-triphosphate reductase activating protein [Caldiserica bacterium]|nr:anaerobic ribonucleoside-triphosphate reductase activating protein [Caldisericota bacterium]